MEKLRESIYFKRTDLNDECFRYDRANNGRITRDQFAQALKLSRARLTPKEIEDITVLAPRDATGKIMYREFQKSMQSSAANRNPEIYSEENYQDKVKVAHALKDQLENVIGTEVSEAMFVSFIRRT